MSRTKQDLTWLGYLLQPPPTQRRKKSRRNSTRSLRNAPGPLTRQLSAGSAGTGTGLTTPAQTTPRVHRRQASEGSGSDMDTASLASRDSGNPHSITLNSLMQKLPFTTSMYAQYKAVYAVQLGLEVYTAWCSITWYAAQSVRCTALRC